MKKENDGFTATLTDEGVYILLPDSNSPYSPTGVFVGKKGLILDVYDKDLGKILPKRIMYRDGIIMHKTLSQIINR